MASGALTRTAFEPPRRAPEGYTRFLMRGADVVALTDCVDAIRQSLATRTLYSYAESHPKRRQLSGRVPAYAVPLPDTLTQVVIRHSYHGGLLAAVTGDRFLVPTRAPRELEVSLRLSRENVATPQVVAYATYPAGPLLQRADIATRELAGGRDLAAVFTPDLASDERRCTLEAVIALLRSLRAAGARHPDLNVKNILIAPRADGSMSAWVIDVDRVVFQAPGDARVGEANLRRLLRSARKWRERHSMAIDESDLAFLVAGSEAG
jgi:3-deoxy-D-manno-octulosonic acid kinase